ncbi:MAG: endonuclease/exonuclease/phosphatase family protein [Flavobacteriales bacterium]|jgi:endonuclease/exonuclease/phosphatase family metal-dependent hydrolase|uniref:endonuclease/exonuclease/phosphatase family protein n=1 Tax=Candidatus Ulvibacter alkanivorans TaxID=2267620 RepID=UPI000DF3A101|nr:endonuclease/exonuclease/phosphatase family protein [Candidatus Ulvibacter alkanivorans]MCH2490031.1 endonuclease/exonuclease/phosphatase family protein [Flavobacteriales bacterium]
MKLTHYLFACFVCSASILFAQQEKTYKVNTVAFYNLENLFDYEDDPITFDDDRTPEGKDRWTKEIYEAKLKNMAQVISEIGRDVTGTAPALVGVCESENRRVLEDLVNQDALIDSDYGIVQYDSPDRRGIDVALLYQKGLFTPTHTKAVPLLIYDDNDPTKRIYTRDQLVVTGMLDGDKIHVIVNHWPSRSGGEARSRPKRIKAAKLNKQIIDSLFSEDPYAKIITMGDFNDDPTSPSVKEYLNAKEDREDVKIKELYNPMESFFKKGIGTLAWRDGWNLFDQMIISSELLKKDYSSYRFYKAGIYNKTYLANPRGRYEGYPYRSFADGGFTGGYSDHFPVYLLLIKETE